MAYRVIITDRAKILADKLASYLFYVLNNRQATKHLHESMEKITARLETNPFQFNICRDQFLAEKGYREAILGDMNYVMIFRVEKNDVFVLGVFHQSEQYENKLNESIFEYRY